MKSTNKLVFLVLLALVFILAACTPTTPDISSFEDCVAAGHPILESYPRQCQVGTQVFREDSTAPQADQNIPAQEPIGGQTDNYGCLGPAGYSWNEVAQACVRSWELNEAQLAAASKATQGFEAIITIISVEAGTCEACHILQVQRNTDKELFTVAVNEEGIQWIANAMDEQ